MSAEVRRFRVVVRSAKVRSEPDADAREVGELQRNEQWVGVVVLGRIEGRPARWVRAEDGRCVYRELLTEEV